MAAVNPQAKVIKIDKLPFAGTKAEIKQRKLKEGKYCDPEQFESKALSHLGQTDERIVRLIRGTLITVVVPVPQDPLAITQAEQEAIDDAEKINLDVVEADAKLRNFLVASLDGQPHDTITAKTRTGQERTGLESWRLLINRYQTKEIMVLETMLEQFKINVFENMEDQLAQYEDIVGQIAVHANGAAKTDKELGIKLLSKFPDDRNHYYTECVGRITREVK